VVGALGWEVPQLRGNESGGHKNQTLSKLLPSGGKEQGDRREDKLLASISWILRSGTEISLGSGCKAEFFLFPVRIELAQIQHRTQQSPLSPSPIQAPNRPTPKNHPLLDPGKGQLDDGPVLVQ
jgi:hypothetical protein